MISFRLLANTAGAGAALEIMPLLNGEDGLPNPIAFDATGYAGMTFHYDTSPNPWGSTALLTGFDTYKLSLYVDFALVGLTFTSNAPGPQSCCLPNGSCADLTAEPCAVQGGLTLGGGTSCACDPCAATAPPPAPDGRNGTAPLRASRLSGGGGSVQVTWDASSCTATDYNILYGSLSTLASYSLSGSVCSIGNSGAHSWTAVPAASIWFVVVGTDGAGTESSWGVDGANQERNGSVVSGLCGAIIKDVSRTCP